MLSEEIKENLKQNNILLIDIHQLGYELEKAKHEQEAYMLELKKFINDKTDYIMSLSKNGLLKIYMKEEIESYLRIIKHVDYVDIHVFSLLDLGNSYFDRYLEINKDIIIYNEKKDKNLEGLLFKFCFELNGEDEYKAMSYNVECLKNGGKNSVQLDCGEAGDIFEMITKELENNGTLNKDFFDILSLSTDLNTKHLEEVFLPVFGMEDRNLKLKEQLLNISKKSIKNIF